MHPIVRMHLRVHCVNACVKCTAVKYTAVKYTAVKYTVVKYTVHLLVKTKLKLNSTILSKPFEISLSVRSDA